MDDVDALVGELISDQETASELGRARAYQRCVRYAEEHLATSPLCNMFLLRAAERLGQPPKAIPVVHNRVPVPDDARLCLYWDDELGQVMVGNADGLRYAASLLLELSRSRMPGESVWLDPFYEPFVGESDGLVVYQESEDWFDAYAEGLEGELVEEWSAELEARIVDANQVLGVQFRGPIAGDLALTPQKIYRVEHQEPLPEGDRKARGRPRGNARLFTLVDDNGQPARLALDLDDPDLVLYYAWHLEQFIPETDD